MITNKNYGAVLVALSFALLVFLLTCSFFVSYQIIDLVYLITVIVFIIKFVRMK